MGGGDEGVLSAAGGVDEASSKEEGEDMVERISREESIEKRAAWVER